MERNLQSNRQGRPRRGSEHHVPLHSIILVCCIVYNVICSRIQCHVHRAYKHDFRREQPQPRGSCLGRSLLLLPWLPCTPLGAGRGRAHPWPAVSGIGRRGRMGLEPAEAPRRRRTHSRRPALLSQHHDINQALPGMRPLQKHLCRGQRPRHRRKQPSQGLA